VVQAPSACGAASSTPSNANGNCLLASQPAFEVAQLAPPCGGPNEPLLGVIGICLWEAQQLSKWCNQRLPVGKPTSFHQCCWGIAAPRTVFFKGDGPYPIRTACCRCGYYFLWRRSMSWQMLTIVNICHDKLAISLQANGQLGR
jgi:hypothetical protein